MDIISIQRRINPQMEFDCIRGRNGEIYLFYYGHFISSCENWQEVEAEKLLCKREVAV